MTDIGDRDIRRLDGVLLLVFRELMRHRRATKAAERLGMSQSGISHALARLRDAFGDPLFLRRSHGLEPTGCALEILPKIEAMIALAQDAMGGAARFDPAQSVRQFQVGAAEFLISLAAAPMFRCIEREAPNASVVFRHFLGEDAVGALHRGEIELALGPFGDLPDTVVRETIFTDRFVIVAREGHPALRDGIDLKLFASLGHVMVSATGGTTGLLDPMLTAHGVRRRIVGVVPRYLTAFGVVASTDVLVFAPLSLAQRYAEGFGVQIIQPPFNDFVLDISAIRLRETLRDSGAAWLLSRLRGFMSPAEDEVATEAQAQDLDVRWSMIAG